MYLTPKGNDMNVCDGVLGSWKMKKKKQSGVVI